MATKRQRIIEAIQARLNGSTSASARVYRGRLSFSDTDRFPLISLLVGDSTVIDTQGERNKIELPLDIAAVVWAELDNPGDEIEIIIGEIKTSLAMGDSNLFQDAGIDRAKIRHSGDSGISHNDGDDYISASVQLLVEYVEIIGLPDV